MFLFGNGFLGDWKEGTRGTVNELCHEGRLVAVSSNIGFNVDNQALAIKGLANLSNFELVVDDILQVLINYTALARLVKEQLADKITLTTSSGPIKVMDAQEVHYLGASNGGTFGFVVAATSPQISRAVLTVGGGGLVHFLQRAVQWNEYGVIVGMLYRDALERQLALSLLQHVVDPARGAAAAHGDTIAHGRGAAKRRPRVAANKFLDNRYMLGV